MHHGSATLEFLRAELGWDPGKQFDDYVRTLDPDGQPTAYLFRCLHCDAGAARATSRDRSSFTGDTVQLDARRV